MRIEVQPPYFEQADYINSLVANAESFLRDASITSYSVSTECLSGKSINPIRLVAIV